MQKPERRWLSWESSSLPILERAGIGATVDEEVLAGDVARLCAAKVRAGFAEFRRIAQTSCGNCLQPLGGGLFLREARRLREPGEGLARPIRQERSGQQIVD